MNDEVIKEAFSITLDAGSVNPDDVDGVRDAIDAVLLSGIGALKARGFSSAKLKLNFKASTKG